MRSPAVIYRARTGQRLCAAAIFAVALLGGCTSYTDKPLKPGDTASAFLNRSLSDPQLLTFLGKNLGKDFSQSTPAMWNFDELNWVAFYYQPSLDVARAQWAVARGGIVTAGESPNPSVSLVPGYDFNPGSAITPWFPGVNLDWPIETAGKLQKRVLESNWTAEAARLNILATAWQVRSKLREALIDYCTAQRRAELLHETATAQNRVLELLTERLNAGAVAADELSTARVALVRTEADAGQADQQLAVTRTALAEALGVPTSAVESQQFSDTELAQAPLLSADKISAARDLSLHTRPDILSSLATYEASQARLQLEIAKQYPDVRLGTGYLYDLGEHKWDISFGFDLPVMNRNEGPVAEAEAGRTAAAADFIATQAHVIAEIDSAAATNAAAAQTVVSLQHVYDALQDHLSRVAVQRDAGGADQLDYQTALLDLQTSSLALVDARAQAALASGKLEDAFQVPIENLSAVQTDPRMPAAPHKP